MNRQDSSPPARPKRRSRWRSWRRPSLTLLICTLLYGLALLGVTLVNLAGPDRWWYGSLNLFIPQWPWALPCVVLVPWYLMGAWRWSWVPLLMLGWVFGPIMGFSIGPSRFLPKPHGAHLRVMTYNVKWGSRDKSAVLANIAAADPDVILMQDSGAVLDTSLSSLSKPGWSDLRLGQYTVMSRFPISQMSQRWLTIEHDQEFLRCVLRVGSRDVTLYDVHLVTPRWALGTIADYGADGARDMQQNAAARDLEALMLVGQLESEKGPVIVAGDLNAPIQSRVCRSLFRAGLRDAFSEAGWGYGYTYGQSTSLERPYVRIDHILASGDWSFVNCAEGSPQGSDHSPVIADLLLPN